MKSILLSIKPEWLAKILNGEKTIEIRKTMPKCDLPIDVYIYCTKDNENNLFCEDMSDERFLDTKPYQLSCVKNRYLEEDAYLNSKVVAKFTLRKVVKYPYVSDKYDELIGSCLSKKELLDYSTIKIENGVRFVKTLYAWHIEDLVIFDKPKELSEFWNRGKQLKKGVFHYSIVRKAP